MAIDSTEFYSWQKKIKESLKKNLVIRNVDLYLHSDNGREFSSVGLEHLPYKQRVGGSSPSTPTKKGLKKLVFKSFFYINSHGVFV